MTASWFWAVVMQFSELLAKQNPSNSLFVGFACQEFSLISHFELAVVVGYRPTTAAMIL